MSKPRKTAKFGGGNDMGGSVLRETKQRRPKASVKGILKHPYEQESLAQKSGIMRKDASKLHRQGLGMNPNMDFEDEYIENLLKQIHFMNMECKLLKEKQSEGKGYLGIRGMIERDKNQLPQHLVQAIEKHYQMEKGKQQSAQQLSRKKEDLQQNNSKLQAEKDHLEKELKQTGEDYTEVFKDLKDQKTKKDQEYRKSRRQREKIQGELQRITRELGQAGEQNDILDKECQFLNLNLKKEEEAHDFDRDELQQKIDYQQEYISKLQQTRTNLKNKIKANVNLRELKKTCYQIMKLCKEELSNLDQNRYLENIKKQEVKQGDIYRTENLIELKKLKNDYERLKDMYKESRTQNQKKILMKCRENESIELKTSQGELAHKETEMAEIDKKLKRLKEREKKFEIDRIQMSFVKNRLVGKINNDQKEFDYLKEELAKKEKKINENTAKLDTINQKIDDAHEEQQKQGDRLDILVVTNQSLEAEVKQRQTDLTILEDLDHVTLHQENITNLTASNKNTNDDAEQFKKDWSEIKKYAKNLL